MMDNVSPEHAGQTSVCNFRAAKEAAELLVQRSQKLTADLQSFSGARQLALICDSRPLHRDLFIGLAPATWPDAPGTWRGTPGSTIHRAPRAVFLARRMPGLRARDICVAAADVAAAMEGLAQQVQQLWDDRPGFEDPWRDSAYAALADVTARFFAIHPYMDGNGHVWRLCLPVLGKRLGLIMRQEWSVDRRPYGPEFSLAIQWYRDHPTILADQLRRWMATSGTVTA